MAAVNTLSTLDALFKQVYPEDFSLLIPEYEDIMSSIEFMKAGGGSTTGDFVQPVVLSRDHGITFLGDDPLHHLPVLQVDPIRPGPPRDQPE